MKFLLIEGKGEGTIFHCRPSKRFYNKKYCHHNNSLVSCGNQRYSTCVEVQVTVNALSTSQGIYQQIGLLGTEEVMEGVKDLIKKRERKKQ